MVFNDCVKVMSLNAGKFCSFFSLQPNVWCQTIPLLFRNISHQIFIFPPQKTSTMHRVFSIGVGRSRTEKTAERIKIIYVHEMILTSCFVRLYNLSSFPL